MSFFFRCSGPIRCDPDLKTTPERLVAWDFMEDQSRSFHLQKW